MGAVRKNGFTPTRTLAYHRRARLERVIGEALEELERQIEELRRSRSTARRAL
jgi:hypothetical protein